MVMKDFCIEQNTNLENPALIGEMLGAADVNIEGLCLTTCEELTVIHLAVEDAVTARRVLENSGIKIKGVSEVFVFSKDKKRITGKPGSFGEFDEVLEPGDSYSIPENVKHTIEVLETGTVIDFFSPPRKDYL